MEAKAILERAIEIQKSKGHDYVRDVEENQYENFERVATVVSWFNDPIDQVYVTLIMTKLVRLAVLLGNKKPKNESIIDTFVDGANYFALWGGKRTQK